MDVKFLEPSLELEEVNYIRYILLDFPPQTGVFTFFPMLYPLHNIMEQNCGMLDENGSLVLPTALRLTKDSLESNGIYLLDNCFTSFLWVGQEVEANLCAELFNCNNYQEISTNITEVNKKILFLV